MLVETNVDITSSSKSISSLSKSTSSSSQSYKRPFTDVEENEYVRVPKYLHDKYLNCYEIVKKMENIFEHDNFSWRDKPLSRRLLGLAIIMTPTLSYVGGSKIYILTWCSFLHQILAYGYCA